MDSDMLDQLKLLLKNKAIELQEDTTKITEKMQPEDVCIFQQKMFNDSEYYDKKYFDEDKFEQNIRILFGEFPIDNFTDEADDYRKLYVYNRALKDFVGELNGI